MTAPDDAGPEYPSEDARPPLLRLDNVNRSEAEIRAAQSHQPASPNMADWLTMARAQEQAKRESVDHERTEVLWRDREARASRRKVAWGMVIAVITGVCLASAPTWWMGWALNLLHGATGP